MKIPEGRLKKVTGFMVETEHNEIVFALHEIDFACIGEFGFVPKIFHDYEARAIYNELYKRFPK